MSLFDLAVASGTTTMEDLNKLPLFMTELDTEENVALEALQALAYDGTPEEVATNFKNQGNDMYKAKRYKDAYEYYTKGIQAKPEEALVVTLYLNRAQASLAVKNFRKCVNDCRVVMQHGFNQKAAFKMGKAFLGMGRLAESKETLEYSLKVKADADTSKLLDSVTSQMAEAKRKQEAADRKKAVAQAHTDILADTLGLRGFSFVASSTPLEALALFPLHLEDPVDPELQVIMPAMVMFPLQDQFDIVGEVGELTSVGELVQSLEVARYGLSKVDVYMETIGGGLVRIGAKKTFHELLLGEPQVPLMDRALRLYVVDRASRDWATTWDKKAAMLRRQ